MDSFGQHCPMHIIQTETKGLFSRIFCLIEAEVSNFSALSYVTSTIQVLLPKTMKPTPCAIKYKCFYNMYSTKQFLVSGVKAKEQRRHVCSRGFTRPTIIDRIHPSLNHECRTRGCWYDTEVLPTLATGLVRIRPHLFQACLPHKKLLHHPPTTLSAYSYHRLDLITSKKQ